MCLYVKLAKICFEGALERNDSPGKVQQLVALINSGTSRATNLMRCLPYLAATQNFRMRASHIETSGQMYYPRITAISLSNPTIPAAVLDLLQLHEPD